MHNPFLALRLLLARAQTQSTPLETSTEPLPTPADDTARRSNELLARWIDLESSRGSLSNVGYHSNELERLDEQRRAGTISDEQYEAEKMRILGG
jgi:hypothetical protein